MQKRGKKPKLKSFPHPNELNHLISESQSKMSNDFCSPSICKSAIKIAISMNKEVLKHQPGTNRRLVMICSPYWLILESAVNNNNASLRDDERANRVRLAVDRCARSSWWRHPGNDANDRANDVIGHPGPKSIILICKWIRTSGERLQLQHKLTCGTNWS